MGHIGPKNRQRARLAAGIVILGVVMAGVGCASYGLVTRAGVAPGALPRILDNPGKYTAFGCAPTTGPRAGEWVAMYWDVRGDGVKIVGERIPSPDRDRWQRLELSQVDQVWRAILGLVRQNETFTPRLYRIVSEKGRTIGYYYSAIWGWHAPVIKVRPGLYTIREVNLEKFKWGDDPPLMRLGIGFQAL
ncbi:MAG: hypothetical protein KJ621_16060 [Proteobacteria bacterium]|nr:hypothetical protein [Pseudomonadota bacterium]MBU1741325.1 hypothetical protein [Pseudomonadota bacterium]